MHIESIWQYPVKSMIGVKVPTAEVTSTGMVGDRIWALRDEERGGIRGAKKIAALMRFAAEPLGDGGVTITLPDGRQVLSSDTAVNEVLSRALDHRVTLWPLQPAGDLEHYRRGPGDTDDLLEEIRNVFGRETNEPLPDFSVFPPEIIEFESPPGTYVDAHPLVIMTTSALSSLAAALPDSSVDVRRFRPNLVVDTADETGHPEFAWRGRRLAAGTAVLEILAGCPRCVMVTREVAPDVPEDRRVLRHIVGDLDQNLGVYARIVEPGRVTLGDELGLL